MSYLLEILGRGLLAELAAAFRALLSDQPEVTTDELREHIRKDPACVEARRALGLRLLAEKNWREAHDEFTTLLMIDAKDHVGRIGLACTFDELGQTRDAAEQLRRVLAETPEDAPSWFALGFCQEKLGQTEDAIVSYENALDNSPELRNAHERLAAIYFKLDNVDMATLHYEHLCWSEPGDLAAGLTLANLYLRAGRHQEAIDRYQYVITIEPDNWDARDDLVAAYDGAGRFDEAIAVLNELIQRRPECAEQLLQLGDLHQKLDQRDEAARAYARGGIESGLPRSHHQGRHRATAPGRVHCGGAVLQSGRGDQRPNRQRLRGARRRAAEPGKIRRSARHAGDGR